MLLNNIRRGLIGPDVTTMSRQPPLQTSVGYSLSSSLARRAKIASRMSLDYPDFLDPSRNERNHQAAANEVLLGSQSTLVNLLRCHSQNRELFS
jgi:hypothetical protein